MSPRPLFHPPIDSITVTGLLHALSDPVRLSIVRELRTNCAGMNCVETMAHVDEAMPKSTCSLHFQILREAGLIRSERRGVELSNQLRLEELDQRFPGLLDSILEAHHKELARPPRKK